MSEIKALEELRHHAHVLKGGSTDYNELFEIADEIEAEIAERYMELPVDADGVPIRIGDTVCEVDVRVPIEVMSLTFYEDCVDVNVCGMNPNMLRHVNLRTLEDIVIEYRLKAYNLYADSEMSGEERVEEFKTLDAEIAAEIRELLGVDA